MADEAHLKRLNVIKLIGRRRILMIGRTTTLARLSPSPAKRRVLSPFCRIIPEVEFAMI